MSLRFEKCSGGRSDRGGRGSGSFVVWAAVAIGVILVWTVGAFALGGGDPGSNPERNAASENAKERGAESEGSLPDSEQIPTGEGNVSVSNRPKDGGRGNPTPEDAESVGTPENIGDENPHGETHLPEGGASHEPGSYDPLGVSGQDVPLLPADKERVRTAAAQFVAAAYGYTGGPGEKDVREYISGVSDHALTPELYASLGAAEFKRYEELVRSSGTKSAALLDLFDIREVVSERRDGDGYTQQRVVGYAYFTTADEYNRYGEVEGNEKSYRQKLTLERYRAVFKVYAAGEIEEVSE
jgi:hypothetical protein